MKIDGWQIPLATFAFVMGASAYCSHPATSSEAVAAWVQAVGSVGAILAAVWVAHRQYTQTRQLELEHIAAAAQKEHAEVRAFIQSIRQELSTIWEAYNSGMRRNLLAVQERQYFAVLVAAQTEAFTVFNNASAQVGKVPDEELRRLIVETYARAKGHIYSMQLNNVLIADLNNFAIMYRGDDRAAILKAKCDGLVEFAAQLRQRDAELEQHYHALIARADEWLRTQDQSA